MRGGRREANRIGPEKNRKMADGAKPSGLRNVSGPANNCRWFGNAGSCGPADGAPPGRCSGAAVGVARPHGKLPAVTGTDVAGR